MTQPHKPSILTATALAVAFFGACLLVSPPSAQADEHARCRAHIEKAEANLDQAIRRHGERSRQAETRRRELNDEREHCWKASHGYWDGHDHRWHEERDWDRH